MNLNDMYNTLPKSLTMELSVGSPKEMDAEKADARKKLTEEKTPMELSQIGSIAEFPLPSALENIFTSKQGFSRFVLIFTYFYAIFLA